MINIVLCCSFCFYKNLHNGHKVIEIIDDESLKKENKTIEKAKKDFDKFFEKANKLRESIENEIDKINNLYEKIFSEITESFKLKHENLGRENFT